jgi:hypothetical protein
MKAKGLKVLEIDDREREKGIDMENFKILKNREGRPS